MTTLDEFRLYDPELDVFSADGYPVAWKTLKHVVREQAGHRCTRCGHPYRNGEHGTGEWSPCDETCTHEGPFRIAFEDGGEDLLSAPGAQEAVRVIDWLGETGRLHRGRVEARWRILTVHHLDNVKANCRWWNLVALCQRCHLQIQGKVQMARVWPWEHSTWFRPYVAGYYAHAYLGLELERDEVESRLEELLDLERVVA